MPVTTAYEAPAAVVASTRGRRVIPRARPTRATAPHARARWDPDTATRCDSPSIRNSSSVAVPSRRRRSPSTMPSRRSPPIPGTPCMRSSAPARHASSRPNMPDRHAPTSPRHALPVAHAPPRAVLRAHGSPGGSGFRIAENLTVQPSSGTSWPSGQPTRTRAEGSGAPVSLTRTTVPYEPGVGSASTMPVHSRAPQSTTRAASRCHASPCRPEAHTPPTAPNATRTTTVRNTDTLLAPAASPTAASAATTSPAPGDSPPHAAQEARSAARHPTHIPTAIHPACGIDGRSAALIRSSPGPRAPRTSSVRCPARASGLRVPRTDRSSHGRPRSSAPSRGRLPAGSRVPLRRRR